MKNRRIFFSLILCTLFFANGFLLSQNNDYVNSINKYSFDLYNQISSDKGNNVLLSPVSSYYMLLMAYEGSAEETKQEFEKVLYLENSDLAHNKTYNIFEKNKNTYTIFNSVWLDREFAVKDKFQKNIVDKYESELIRTNFKNTESAVADINDWISKKTSQKITTLMNDSYFNEETSLILINTLNFKGEWLNKFDSERTKVATFFTDAENQYDIDFMTMNERLSYFENEKLQFISKPYNNSNLSLCIVLPKDLFGLEEIERAMDIHFINELFDSSNYRETLVSIPRIELRASNELSKVHKQMGLRSAFSHKADFSAINEEKQIILDRIINEIMIDIDEEGTEAAAATAEVFHVKGIPSYHVFRADHPFLFFIIDNQLKTILFMGRYCYPENTQTVAKEDLISNIDKRKKEISYIRPATQKILLIVDGVILPSTELNKLNHEEIQSFSLINEKREIREYSTEDYDGVIIIKLKKNDTIP